MFAFYIIRLVISYQKSMFGYHGTDTVQSQECDSLFILNEVPKPQNVKFINESGFSNPPIQFEEYPWPGHQRTATDEQLNSEVQEVFSRYCQSSDTLTQEDLYSSPVGVLQFSGDDEMVRNSTRYKFRFFMNTRYQRWHWTGIYIPPGELITIEIPERSIGRLRLFINRYTSDMGHWSTRITRLRCDFPLNYQVNKIGWPYGGHLIIQADVDSFNQGFDVNITGGIRMPYFRYGVTSDQEWEEELSKLPAPLMVLDCGASIITMPSVDARRVMKLNEIMAFYRGVSRVLYSVNEVVYYPRRADGRVTTPLEMNLDSFVPAGEAVAFIGANYVQAPPY